MSAEKDRLLAELRAIADPVWFHPLMADILAACGADSIRAASIAVNEALRDSRLRGTTVRRLLVEWGRRFNVAREAALGEVAA